MIMVSKYMKSEPSVESLLTQIAKRKMKNEEQKQGTEKEWIKK